MSHAIDSDHSKIFLLPQCLDDWVSKDHPARFIDAFVNNLDLVELGFKTHNARKGRPHYATRLLLKIWLYGYYNHFYSLRDLERACHNDMGLIWLTSQNTPDHNTLWRFFDHNKSAIENIFKESVQTAIDLDLVGLVLAAVDGTKIAADVSRASILDTADLKKAIAAINEISKELTHKIEQNGDVSYAMSQELADHKALKERIENQRAEMKRKKTKHLSETDPDSRMMKKPQGYSSMSYNSQIVVDDKIGIIIGADVTQDRNDVRQLSHMLEAAEQTAEALPESVVADAGYWSSDEMDKVKDKSHVVVSEPRHRKGSNNQDSPYHQDRFVYDEKQDVYICPQGKILIYKYKTKVRNNVPARVYRCYDHETCPARGMCCRQNKRGRSIKIRDNKEALLEQRSRNRAPEDRLLLRRRKGIVEPVFGYIKHVFKFRRFTFRGLDDVKAQWYLIASVVNLHKIYARYPILAV